MTTRQKKGTVGIESIAGMLRLRLPRALYAGRQKYLSLGLANTPINRQAANLKAQQIELDIALGSFDHTLDKYAAASVEDAPPLAELWEKYTAAKAPSLAKSTLMTDFRKTRNHIKSLPTQNLARARTIKTHLSRTLTPGAAWRCLLRIKACTAWALEEGLISSNPFAELKTIKGKKQDREINPFTREEVEAIIQAFESSNRKHYAPFTRFLFLTGCRTSEAIGLQWRHIAPDFSVITFSEALVMGERKGTKTGKSRRFPCNPALKKLLQSIRSPESLPHDLVFPAKRGGPIDGQDFLKRQWKPTLEQAGVNYRVPYNTRHTFISHCLQHGVPVVQIAQWVGNSPKMIWQHYAGVLSQAEVPEII